MTGSNKVYIIILVIDLVNTLAYCYMYMYVYAYLLVP